MDLLHTLLDTRTDFDAPVVDYVENEVAEIEELVYIRSFDLFFKKIGLLKRQIVCYRQILLPKRDVIMHIVDQTSVDGTDDTDIDVTLLHVAYFRDVNDHIVSSLQQLEVHSEAVQGSESTYLAKVSITVGNAANNVSNIMKKFSSIGTITLPITFITGVFGMNVPIPYQQGGPDGTYFDLNPFYILFISMMLFAIVCAFLFRQNRWL